MSNWASIWYIYWEVNWISVVTFISLGSREGGSEGGAGLQSGWAISRPALDSDQLIFRWAWWPWTAHFSAMAGFSPWTCRYIQTEIPWLCGLFAELFCFIKRSDQIFRGGFNLDWPKKLPVVLIFLDLRATFDRVNHCVILSILSDMDVAEKWILPESHSYLSGSLFIL